MKRTLNFLVAGIAVVLLAWISGRYEAPPVLAQSRTSAPVSMGVVVLDLEQLPQGGRWNELLGRPLVALEYVVPPSTGTGGRTLYLYDARSGECKTVIHAPSAAGTPMLIAWDPCK